LNMQGLKVEKAEYCEAKHFTDMTLRSKEGVVRVAVKDNGDSMPMLLSDKEYTLTLTESVKDDKWSKSQLKYCWGLINKLGNLLMTSKEEEYKILLERYSQSDIEVCPTSEWKQRREEKNIRYYDVLEERVVEDTPITIARTYKGFQQLNSHELNIFIEGVKSECKEMGIDTETPSERALYE